MTSKAKIFDQYFTPVKLADKLIAAFTIPTPNHIGDFAVGDGKLLCAAQKRWPSIKCTAIDIDEDVVNKLKANYTSWKTNVCDFTNIDARNKLLTKRKKNIQLPAIALNPPFSIQKGKVRVRTVFIGKISVRCSPALAFIVDALPYLCHGGQLVAIVPQGVIQNTQDAKARELLARHYGFEVVELISQAGFSHCAPRTAIVRFTSGLNNSVSDSEDTKIERAIIPARLLRGSISNTIVKHSEHPASLPFIHTTDLLDGQLRGPKKNIFLSDVVFATGPAVLMPRVGKPNVNKLALLPTGMTAVLSDCVMAVECLNNRDSYTLHRLLVTNWPSLEQSYGGTCARYISVSNLIDFLTKIGYQSIPCLKELKTTTKCLEEEIEATLAA
jgi:predicted RNA methylase